MRDHDFDLVVSFGAEFPDPDVAWVNSVHRAWLQRAQREPGGLVQRFGRYFMPRHRVVLATEKRYFRNPTLRWIISAADAVTDDLVRVYGVDESRASTIHNGYNPAQFSPTRRAQLRSSARTSLSVGPDDVVLLVVANELRRKGLGTVLEAVAELGDPRLRVVLAGRTPPTEFSALTESLGLAGRFHYAGASDDVGYLHAAADLFVLPTQYEAFCLAIVESLASGLPVITTAVPGAGDAVITGTTGLIQSEPRSATELARLLGSALEPGVLARWSAAAPASVGHLSWPEVLTEAQEILERVAEATPSHR